MSIIKVSRLIVAGAAALLLVVVGTSASADEQIRISAVSVTAARPGQADIARLRRLFDLRALTDQQVESSYPVYVVKVFASVPSRNAPLVLSIGSAVIPMYGAFDAGLFVRVYDPAKLAAWSGRTVKLVLRGGTGAQPVIDPTALGSFPTPPAAAPRGADGRLKTVDQVLQRL